MSQRVIPEVRFVLFLFAFYCFPFVTATMAEPLPESAVVIEPDVLLPAIQPGQGPEIPVCVDGSTGTLVAGCDSVTGEPGPQGPQGEPGEPGNLALANAACPPDQFLTGFDAGGNLVCSATPGDCSALPGYGDPCTVGVGECERTGALICGEASTELNCSVTAGDPSPAEACDYLDNDCDGMVDEDFPTLGSVCSAGVGICARTSVMVCNLTGDGTECGASPGEATAESCNGSDDDCDGLVDEDFPGLGDACSVGVGACQQSGIMVCNGPGSGTECSATPAGSTAETCNGIDDDCDGLVDEDFPGLGDACSVGVGACQQSGIMVCNGPGSGTECSAIPAGSTSETCNGIDDDCDGMVDEGIAELCALQTGVCLGSSKQCGGTLGFLDCSFSEYGPSYEPQEVSCDGEDNDCDGSIDNTLFTPYCDSQAGVCAGSVKTCDGANGWLACGPEAYGPEYEPNETVCDYLDNDCDGQVDEGFDLDYDENHCGYCGRVCDSPPNSSAICEFGSCGFSCDSGWYDCDHDYWNGCESAVPCE